MRKLLCLCLVFTLCLCLCSCKSSDYKKAMSLYEAGEYEEAIAAFEALADYKDSVQKIADCELGILENKYNNAIALMEAGNIIEAYNTFTSLNGYKDSAEKAESIYDQYLTATLKVAKVGDIITFGSYENEKIDWYVLEKTEDRVFVISQYFVDVQCYDEEPIRGRQAYWDGCSLRTWLNDTFLNEAFTEAEKSRIPTVEVKTHEGYVWTDKMYLTTEDRVYLLSSEEAKEYTYEVMDYTDKILTYEEALEIFKKTISKDANCDGKVYDKVEFGYVLTKEYINGNFEIIAVPSWQFNFEGIPNAVTSGYDVIVNAIDGSVYK